MPLLLIIWEQVSGTKVWAPAFIRDGFVVYYTLVSFFNKLNCHKFGDSLHDTVTWDLDSKGNFTVKSYYLKLLLLNFPSLQFLIRGGFPSRLL